MNVLRRVAVRLTLRARIVVAVLVPALGAGTALTVWALDQRDGAQQARDARERVELITAYTHVYDNVNFTREITDMVSYVGGLDKVPASSGRWRARRWPFHKPIRSPRWSISTRSSTRRGPCTTRSTL